MNFGQKSWYLPWHCPFKLGAHSVGAHPCHTCLPIDLFSPLSESTREVDKLIERQTPRKNLNLLLVKHRIVLTECKILFLSTLVHSSYMLLWILMICRLRQQNILNEQFSIFSVIGRYKLKQRLEARESWLESKYIVIIITFCSYLSDWKISGQPHT